jgi:low affinity Fe/Cu permease
MNPEAKSERNHARSTEHHKVVRPPEYLKSTEDRRQPAIAGSKIVRLRPVFNWAASVIASPAGKPTVFALAVLTIILWAITGPFFNYSDTWQLIINTGTTIVTFLMVFLIQNSQNRDGAAIQVKLDELIRVSAAKNCFVGIEHLTDEEIERLRTMCEARAKGSR